MKGSLLKFGIFVAPVFLCALSMLVASPVYAAERAEVFVQTGHAMSATSLDFSPGGDRLVSCDGAGSVIAWDTATGLQYRSLYRHLGLCLNVALSPDGQRVYSSGGARNGQQLVESDYVTGAVRQVWAGHSGLIVGMWVTQDGVWTLGESDGLKYWQAKSAKAVRTVSLPQRSFGNATQLIGLPNSNTLWVGGREGQVLELAEGRQPRLVASFNVPVASLAISPDGAFLAVSLGTFQGSQQKSVLILEVSSGKVVRTLDGHNGNVVSLAFSPDGSMLASVAQIDFQALMTGQPLLAQEQVRLWSLTTGALLATANNNRNEMGTPFLRAQLKFSRDSKLLSVAAWDEAVRVYSLSSLASDWKETVVLEGRGAPALQVALNDDGGSLAVSLGRSRVRQAPEYYLADQVIKDFGGESKFTEAQKDRLAVLYGPKGFRKSRQHVSLWDLMNGQMKSTVDWQLGPTSWMAASREGSGFVSLAALFPNTMTVSPLKSRLVREARLNKGGEPEFQHFSYERSQGEPSVVTDESVAIQDHAYSVELMNQNSVGSVTVVASNRMQAPAGQREYRLHVIQNVEGRREISGEWGLPGRPLSVAVSKNGQVIWASVSVAGEPHSEQHQGQAVAYDATNGRVLGQWNLPKGVTAHQLGVHATGHSAAFSGDSRLVVAQIGHKKLRRVAVWKQADRPITALSVSPESSQLVLSNTAGQAARLDWSRPSAPKLVWNSMVIEPFPHLWAWSGDQKRLVAASDDGRVRVLDPKNGSTVLNLFQFDGQEWLSITNEGYFAASSKGDEWVNVRVNQRVYRIGQFYDVFYRPDIVQRVMQGLSNAGMVNLTLDDAIRRPPPQVVLSGASNDSMTTASIGLDLSNMGGGIGEVRLFLNGKLIARDNKAIDQIVLSPAASSTPVNMTPSADRSEREGEARPLRALKLASRAQREKADRPVDIQRLTLRKDINLVPGDNEIVVMALNSAGDLSSRPARVAFRNPAKPSSPTLWLLSMGVDQFQATLQAPQLNFAVKDSQRFARELALPLSKALKVADTKVIELTDGQVTRKGVELALDRIAQESGPEDVFVWFVASHGTLDDLAQYGMVLHDWSGKTAPGELFSSEEILNASTRIKAARQLVILDTCHAGGLNGWLRGLFDARFSVLARNSGLHLFASAGETQQALDGYQGNGLYTHVLLNGVRTPLADQNQDGRVDTSEWGSFATRETSRIAKLLRHRQEPMMMNFGKEIPVYEKP